MTKCSTLLHLRERPAFTETVGGCASRDSQLNKSHRSDVNVQAWLGRSSKDPNMSDEPGPEARRSAAPTPARSSLPPDILARGATIGRYVIVAVLGQGGMG